MLTGNRDAYFKNYQGTGDELATTLNKGWLFTGQVQPVSGKRRGADPSFLRPEQFVYCISNHDQVGNRAFGERLSHLVSPAAYRAASVLLLLAPYTPLIFMGHEWAASSPFQFFTDHNPELGEKIIVGRRREFRDFAGFRDATVRESIPSPQEEGTFRRSKLNWDERESADRKDLLGLYRECIRLRNGIPALRLRSRENWRVVSLENDVVAVVYGERTDECCVLVTDLGGNGISMEAVEKIFGCALSFKTLLDSSGTDSGGDVSAETKQPRTILLQSI
jgi:maltooligosyltrehalose trehalohydrolase